MKLLFAGASDGGYYRTQRKLLARLISDNHQIVIVSPRSNAAEKLIAIGCKFIEFPMQRHGVNPFEEIELIRKYRTILKSEKPDIVLTNTIKPNLYMGLLCRFMKIPYVMNITGLGEGLLHEGRTKKVILKIYPIATKKAYCIFFQNVFNRQFFIDNKLADPNVFRMLPGSGVDVTDYLPIDYPSDANGIRFMFVSRILKDKGIEELVNAFKIAKTKYNNIELHIAGGCAEEYEESLKAWIKYGIVQYHGRVDDMKPLYGMMHCLIHPSYHEGMANVILESAACARPCLVSNINGCKEGVDDGKSGFVFPVKSVYAIVEKIDKFMDLSNEERRAMGLEGRHKMEKEFNRDIVDAAYIRVISEIETRNNQSNMAEQQMHGFRARLDYVLKHNQFISVLFRKVASACMRLWGLFVPVDSKMVIMTAHGRKYNDSPRAIYEYMLKTGKFKEFKIVWGLEDPTVEIPGNPIKVKADTIAYFRYTLKAKYWITCVNIERSLHYKKKSQIYLNTWHGTALNTMGNAVSGRKDFDFSHIDFFGYESEFQRKHCIDDFNCREEAMVPMGLPRNDTLYYTTPEEVLTIKKKLGLPLDKKIILYAPTWRESKDNGVTYAIKPPINLKKWEDALADEYILLFRTHAYTNKVIGVEFNDFVRDFISYPVVNDLFKVADILISDYSSCITDFSILGRPIICFAYDYDDYCNTHGLNLDFRTEMPNGIKETEDEVLAFLKVMDYEKECENTKIFNSKYTNIGGHATEICIEKMFGKEYLAD